MFMKFGNTTGPSVAMEGLESRRHFAVTLPAGFKETRIVTGLPEVTSMEFAPDGRLFITELAGKVRIVKNGVALSTPFLSLNVDQFNNRGLIGLTFDPNFALNRYIYVFYSKVDPNNPDVENNASANRVSRFTANNTNKDVYQMGSEVVLLDNIPNGLGGHNGGALKFGKDGMLYVTTGETGLAKYGQDLTTLAGKILRLNVKNYPNSIIPTDNPFVGQAGKRAEIWAYGMRHPYTAAIHPTTGMYLVNDVGGDKWEEIDEIQKGRNYGWGNVEGNSTNTAYKNPMYTYSHNGSSAAIVGGTFYTGTQFPAEYKDKYFFADFEDDWVKVLDTSSKVVTGFATGLKAPVDMDMGPDGALYYLAYNDRYSTTANRSVYKFEYVGAGNRAPLAEYTVNPITGNAPLTVSFDASNSSDPDGDTISYLWDFGDGTTSTDMVTTHTYDTAGSFIPKLTATDPGGLFDTDTLPTIKTNNSAPTGTITLPAAGTTYRAGSTISFTGTGTDPEDGTLGAASLSWAVRLFHNEHSHPFLTFNGVSGASFKIPDPGEIDPVQWYRITLTVTDSAGGTHSSFIDVKPEVSTVTLATSVPGLSVNLDGQSMPDGSQFTGVENAARTLSAPQVQTLNGKWYAFDSWSDAGAAQHDIATPVDDTTFTASYHEIPVPESATLTSAADAYVRDGASATTNFGDAIELVVKKSTTAGNSREAYINFDTSSAAPGGTAKLRLYGQLGNLTGTIKPVPVGVYAIADNTWDEAALTYNTRPAAGTLLKSFSVVQGGAQWYEIDVTSYVESERAAGRNVVGFLLRATAATDPLATFGSDESANRPELVLAPKPPSQDYALPAVADATVRNGTFGNTNYGNDVNFFVKKSSTSGNTRESYLKFDLSAITTPITAAKLRLFGALTNVTDAGIPNVAIYKATTTTWSEPTITYNNRPAASTTILAQKPITGTVGQWFEFDLTSFLQAEKAAGRSVVTLVLKATNTTNPVAAFNSGEAVNFPPELVVTA
jgi:glucose/arabinose dehydrogenase